jgi:hypothetical protein
MEADVVPVAQAPSPVHPLAVDERAVARQAVVRHDPVAAHDLQLRVHARHLVVPVDRHVVGHPAPDQHGLPRGRQDVDALLAVDGAQDQERPAETLRLLNAQEIPGVTWRPFGRPGVHGERTVPPLAR